MTQQTQESDAIRLTKLIIKIFCEVNAEFSESTATRLCIEQGIGCDGVGIVKCAQVPLMTGRESLRVKPRTTSGSIGKGRSGDVEEGSAVRKIWSAIHIWSKRYE